jgi:hypothetical protein
LTVTQEGLELPIVIGLKGQTTASLVAAGQPVPPPLLRRGLIDTGTDVTCVTSSIVQLLGLSPVQTHVSHTVAGPIKVNLYEVSLGLPRMGNLPASLLVLEQLTVMELTQPPANLDVLLGLDVLAHLLIVLDGPRGEFTLAD